MAGLDTHIIRTICIAIVWTSLHTGPRQVIPEKSLRAVRNTPTKSGIDPHVEIGWAELNTVEVTGSIDSEVGLGTFINAEIGLIVGKAGITAFRAA